MQENAVLPMLSDIKFYGSQENTLTFLYIMHCYECTLNRNPNYSKRNFNASLKTCTGVVSETVAQLKWLCDKLALNFIYMQFQLL